MISDVVVFIYMFVCVQGAVGSSLTCIQLHKKAEKIATLLYERGQLRDGDHVALVYPPGNHILLF